MFMFIFISKTNNILVGIQSVRNDDFLYGESLENKLLKFRNFQNRIKISSCTSIFAP